MTGPSWVGEGSAPEGTSTSCPVYIDAIVGGGRVLLLHSLSRWGEEKISSGGAGCVQGLRLVTFL